MSDVSRPRADLASERVDDDVLLLDKSNGKIHQLNPTASLVWESLQKGVDEQRIAEIVSETFEIDADTAKSDLQKLMKQFNELGLLKSSDLT